MGSDNQTVYSFKGINNFDTLMHHVAEITDTYKEINGEPSEIPKELLAEYTQIAKHYGLKVAFKEVNYKDPQNVHAGVEFETLMVEDTLHITLMPTSAYFHLYFFAYVMQASAKENIPSKEYLLGAMIVCMNLLPKYTRDLVNTYLEIQNQ